MDDLTKIDVSRTNSNDMGLLSLSASSKLSGARDVIELLHKKIVVQERVIEDMAFYGASLVLAVKNWESEAVVGKLVEDFLRVFPEEVWNRAPMKKIARKIQPKNEKPME